MEAAATTSREDEAPEVPEEAEVAGVVALPPGAPPPRAPSSSQPLGTLPPALVPANQPLSPAPPSPRAPHPPSSPPPHPPAPPRPPIAPPGAAQLEGPLSGALSEEDGEEGVSPEADMRDGQPGRADSVEARGPAP